MELKPFKRVTGVDPSENMIRGALEGLQNNQGGTHTVVDFVQSSTEKLDFVEDGSVDLVIAGKWVVTTFGRPII